MRFFLDENFPKAAAVLLESLGHETFDIRGSGAEGATDADIFRDAQERQAVFLTTDRDFFHTVPHLYASHFGVIVVALRQPNRENILARLKWLLDHLPALPFKNRIIQLRDKTWISIPPI